MEKIWRVAAVVGIVATLSLTAVGVYELVPRSTLPNGCDSGLQAFQSLQSPPLVLGTSVDSSQGPMHWYNFTIENANPCAKLGTFSFEVRLPSGSAAILPAGSGVALVTPPDALEAVFDFGTGWTYEPGFSSSTVPSTQDFMSLFYTGSTPSTLVGGSLVVLFALGTVSTTIS